MRIRGGHKDTMPRLQNSCGLTDHSSGIYGTAKVQYIGLEVTPLHEVTMSGLHHRTRFDCVLRIRVWGR